MGRKLFLGFCAVALAAAQDPPIIRETFKFVLAPVSVTDRGGQFVTGLTPLDFRLFDNGKEQRITEDVASHPISLVVAVQANAAVEKILPQVQRMGSMIDGLVTGDNGEVAVVAFDHRIQTITDFTSDPDKIAAAFKKLKAGSWSSRMNDAAMEGIRMLRNRHATQRRTLLMISEVRDNGSEVGYRDVLTAAEFANVVVYSVNMSRLVASLTTQAQPPRPNPIPLEGRHSTAGQIDTPTTDSQMTLGNWTPVFTEIFKDVKGIFVPNPLSVYTRYTGGREYSFMTQKTLEKAISDIGEDLHSQYLLTYSPNNQNEPGFHEIVVQVLRPDLKVRTRDGYYLAGKPE